MRGVLVLNRPARQAVAVTLTDHEQAVLDSERSWWTADGLRRLRDRKRRARLDAAGAALAPPDDRRRVEQ